MVAERLGHALQSLASDLAEQHREVTALKRENAKLRAELSALRGNDD
jgi:cell division protein FtsB